jgi:hypothetical protein
VADPSHPQAARVRALAQARGFDLVAAAVAILGALQELDVAAAHIEEEDPTPAPSSAPAPAPAAPPLPALVPAAAAASSVVRLKLRLKRRVEGEPGGRGEAPAAPRPHRRPRRAAPAPPPAADTGAAHCPDSQRELPSWSQLSTALNDACAIPAGLYDSPYLDDFDRLLVDVDSVCDLQALAGMSRALPSWRPARELMDLDGPISTALPALEALSALEGAVPFDPEATVWELEMPGVEMPDLEELPALAAR